MSYPVDCREGIVVAHLLTGLAALSAWLYREKLPHLIAARGKCQDMREDESLEMKYCLLPRFSKTSRVCKRSRHSCVRQKGYRQFLLAPSSLSYEWNSVLILSLLYIKGTAVISKDYSVTPDFYTNERRYLATEQSGLASFIFENAGCVPPR